MIGKPPARDLFSACGSPTGILCAAGAGGKKSALYALARAYKGATAISATVRCPRPPKDFICLTAPESDLRDLLLRHRDTDHSGPIFFATPGPRAGLFDGVNPNLLDDLYQAHAFDLLLVKADGARRRLIKAPSTTEPIYPKNTSTILYLISALSFGRKLDSSIAHRPELLAVVSGAKLGESIRPIHVARLLASPQGALHRAGNIQIVPVINRIESPEQMHCAREAAELTLKATTRYDRVLLTRLTDPNPVVDIVGRRSQLSQGNKGVAGRDLFNG